MDPLLLRALVVLGVVAAAGVLGWWWRHRDGRVREGAGAFDRERLAQIGLRPEGAEALGLLLSSPSCAPCRTVREILGELAEERDRFRWVSVDAAEHLELARRHGVMRVPTLFVLTPGGRILARTSGVPARHELAGIIDRQVAPRSLPADGAGCPQRS